MAAPFARREENGMKFAQKVIGAVLIAVLASALSIVTAGLIVQSYARSLLAEFNIDLDQPAGIGSMLGGQGAKAAGGEDKTEKEKNPSVSGSTQTPESEGTPSPEDSEDTGAPEDALPVMGSVKAHEEEAGTGADNPEVVVTPDDMVAMKEQLPSAEKMNVFNILMNKLPAGEMQKISTAMEGGLTEDEVKQIQSIIEQYVDEDEYKQLMELLVPGNAETGNMPTGQVNSGE